MKLGPVTKLDKRNKTISKKFDNVMSENCGIIVIFLIYSQFGATVQSVKCIFSFIVTFYLIKTENRTKKSLTQLSHYCFVYMYYLCKIMLIFCKKNAHISKIKSVLALRCIFSETTYVCVPTYQICSF